MSLRSSELSALIAELDAGLTGAFLQKARALVGPRAELEFRQPGRSTLLVVSGEQGLSRVSVKPKGEGGGGEPLAFQRWLRQELVGAKLVRLSLEGPRIVCLGFLKPEKERRLLLELGRGQGRLMLTDGQHRVLASTDSTVRPGSAFPPPPDLLPARSVTEPPKPLAPSRLLPQGDAPFPLARAAEALFGEAHRQKRVEALRRTLGAPHRARLHRLERTREKVRLEAERTPQALQHRLWGELLSQNLGRIPKGVREVQLTHYAEDGPCDVWVPLSLERSPKAQAEWHFHQYRRLLRGVTHARQRLQELDVQAQASREALARLDAQADEALLAQSAPTSDVAAPKRRGAPQARPFREYRGHGGARILVGKGGADNDALTFHVASPHDLWMHALGVQGAHVVVPLMREQRLSPELLLDAAHLALHASKDRHEPSGEVAYTQAKFVRKPKGGAPGQVHYSREKVLRIRMEKARLERLLKSAELGGP